jgi:hypothetical protein
LKGSFSLLAVKIPRAALRLAACNINIFFKLFEKATAAKGSNSGENFVSSEFNKTFNYLYETMRALLIYAKEGKSDLIFKEENLIPLYRQIVATLLIDKPDLLLKLTN